MEQSVTVEDSPQRHRFEARVEPGVVAGFAAYARHDDRVVFTHTEVDEAFEGQGVGSTLVRGALDAVRARGLRVVAQCAFVRDYLARHPEYDDLVA